MNPNETALSWKTAKRERAIHVYLSNPESAGSEITGARVCDLPVHVSLVPTSDWINPDELEGAAAAIVQVDADSGASIKRFQKLATSVDTPLIAGCYDPPLALVRSLIRTGASDVIELPLSIHDLETSISSITEELARHAQATAPATGKLVSVVKSVGGVGATALLSQLAIRFAHNEARVGREACLIDLDLQFGDVAFQLGLRPKLSLADLLEAGTRLDGALLRSTITDHPSGLKVIAAPREMMPLEGVPSDDVLRIAELATREFSTVFVDLPTNWTNWSLSMVARSDLVLLVTELTVAGLNRARRQLELLASQDLGDLEVRVIVNRFDKSLARTVSLADAAKALGRNIGYTVANDFPLVRAAIDRGVPISEIKRKTSVAKDLDNLDSGIAAALQLER